MRRRIPPNEIGEIREAQKVKLMKPTTYAGIGLVLLLGLPAAAQNQPSSNSQSATPDSSLGTYARQIHKDTGAKNKPKVFDNENLPKDDKLSIVGSPTESDAGTSAAQETPSTAASPEGKGASEAKSETKGETKGETKAAAAPQAAGQVQAQTTDNSPKTPDEEQAAKEAQWRNWSDKLDSQREQINLLSRELDVLQREYQLRAAAMYGDVGNRMRNQADWDKQDAQYKQQVADKQKALEDAKQKLDDMQEDARKSGVPASMREQQ